MNSEFDRIWCLQYDEDSFHRPMVKINFSKYLNTILSNQYFSSFQKQAFKQLSNEAQWNQRSWALLRMFEYFNDAFATKQFESNVKFIADRNTRRMFGSFRMWIDLQRLYLLTFLKMDRIQFQQDRIYFSLYRTLFFLSDLLTEYQVSDFKTQFLIKINTKIESYTVNLQKCLPVYMHVLLKYLRQIIPHFLKKQALIDYKDKQDVKKLTFRKLSREYDMMPEVLQRLTNNISFQSKQRQIKQVSNIAQSSQIQSMTKQIQHLYDPRIRIVQQLKKQCKDTDKPYDEKKADQMFKNYQSKQKQKTATQAPYQSLLRTGHNPYDQSNYAIYGETLRVDMNEKQNLQKKQEFSQIQQQPIQWNAQYYDSAYIEKMKKMQINSVAITRKDLNNRAVEEDRDKHYSQDNSTLLKNLQWNQNANNKNDFNLYSNDEDNDDDKDKANPASTLRSINLKKNLQNNALFQKYDEEQKQKSIFFLKKVIRNGIQSDILFQLQQKSSKMFQQMNSLKMISLNSKSTIDRNKFDALRKVAQFHSINKKITTWINLLKVPNLYPRSVEQIKKYYTDTTTQTKKLELAFQSISQ